MRAGVIWLSLIAAVAASAPALADSPLAECRRAGAEPLQVRRCLEARMKAAEGALADAYRAMRDEVERRDRAADPPVAASRFEAAQRAFRDYRDKHCAWIGIMTVDASDAGDLVRDCRIRLAEERTRELQAQLPAQPAAEPEPAPAPEEPAR